MKNESVLILSTSPPTQPEKKLRKTINLSYRQRHPHGKPCLHNTVKESDTETGLYYYGARYLDPKTSRWISGDPALGEYIPVAPVNEEARKRNGNLPGMGGVFNCVNLHVYHYAGNNPVKLVDPDGNTIVISGNRESANSVLNKVNNLSRDQYTIERVNDDLFLLVKSGRTNRSGSREYSSVLNDIINDTSSLAVIGISDNDSFDIDDSMLEYCIDMLNTFFSSSDSPDILNGLHISGMSDDNSITLNCSIENGNQYNNMSVSFFSKNVPDTKIMQNLMTLVAPSILNNASLDNN